MNFLNFLSVSITTYGGFGSPYTLNWIGKIIQWLIESCGSIGIGIIVFTLALKVLTLPLDIISRTSMKKTNLQMKRMRPQLEKLQRQYANNKELYNKKIQALYKKEGYSMFASCLPTIITLVIFIIVINQFSAYSNFTNLETFNKMSLAYTQTIENYDDDVVYKVKDADGNVVKNYMTDSKGNKTEYYTITCYLNEKGVFEKEEFASYREFISNAVYIEGAKDYEAKYITQDGSVDKLAEKIIELNNQGYTEIVVGDDENSCHILKKADGTYVFNEKMFKMTEEEININVTTKMMNYLMERWTENNILESARVAAKESYYANTPRFLWIKNLWLPDLPYKHPVQSSLSSYDFSKKLGDYSGDEAQFSELTYYLSDQKSQPNGYFILVLLSIGTILLQQLLMNKSQKEQMELQTVDGQAAVQSKMMMWMMPIMFGFFAFMYSASFSLYMIVSTVVSTLSTIIINYFVEKSFKKKYGAD